MAKITAQIVADASQFEKVIKQVITSAEEAGKDIDKALEGKVQVDDGDLKRVKKEAKELDGESASVKVTADDGDLDATAKKVKDLDGETANVKVEAEASGFDQITDKFKELAGGSGLGGLISGFAAGGVFGAAAAGVDLLIDGFTELVSLATDYNNALVDMQAKTGATGSKFKELQGAAENAFLGGVGESVAEATKIISEMQNRLGDVFSPKELSNFAKQAQGLGKLYDVDVNEVISKSAPLIKQYGLSGQEAFDIIAKAMKNGGAAQNDLLDSFAEYSQVAQQAGFSAKEFGAILEKAGKDGAFSVDKIGDALKEANIRLNDNSAQSDLLGIIQSSKGAEKAVAQAVENIRKRAEKGDISLADMLNFSNETIEKAFKEGKISEKIRGSLQAALAGSPAEDLGTELFAKAFSKVDTSKLDGELSKAGKDVSKSIGQHTSFESIGRQFELFITKLSQGLIKLFDVTLGPVIGIVTTALSGIKEAFDSVFSGGDGGLGDVLKGIISLIQGIGSAFRNILKLGIFTQFKIIFGVIKGAIDAVMGAVQPLIDIFKGLDTSGSGLGATFVKVQEIFGKVAEIFGKVGRLLFEVIITPTEILIDLVVDLAKWVGGLVKSFLDFIGIGDTVSNIFNGIGSALDNISNIIDGVIGAFEAFKEAIKSLDIGQAFKDLLSGKNPFENFGKQIADGYKKGFASAGLSEDLGKTQSALFKQLDAQIKALAKNRENLSAKELVTEKNRISQLIDLNLKANKLIKRDSIKLSNELAQIKLKQKDTSLGGGATTLPAKTQLINVEFSTNLKDAFKFELPKLDLSDVVVNADGILENFKKPLDDFKEAITGITFKDEQLGKVKDFLTSIETTIEATKKLNENLQTSPQYLENFVNLTGSLSTDFDKFADKNDTTLKKFKDAIENTKIQFNASESETEQAQLLNKLLGLYDKYNKHIIATADVSSADRLKLEAEYQRKLAEIQSTATTKTKDELANELSQLQTQKDNALKILQERKDAENSFLDFFEQRRIEAINDTNEKARIKELAELDKKYKELIAKYSYNEAYITKLREAFAQDRADIIAKYTEKEVNRLQDFVTTLAKAFTSLDTDSLIESNKQISSSIEDVKKDYKSQFAELSDSYNSGSIEYSDYISKLTELDQERNDKIKDLEAQRKDFIDIANKGIIDSFTALTQALNEQFKAITENYVTALETQGEHTEANAKLLEDTMGVALASIGSQLITSVANGENLFKGLLKSVIDVAQGMLNAWAGVLLLKKSVELPFGLGTVEALGIIAAGNLLLALARASLGGAEKGIIGLTEANKGEPGATDTIPMMLAKGESVISASATEKNKKFLEFANKGGDIATLINPTTYNAVQMDMKQTNSRLDRVVNEISSLRADFRNLRVQHLYNKEPKVTINNKLELRTVKGLV